jgi:hypothetical protein
MSDGQELYDDAYEYQQLWPVIGTFMWPQASQSNNLMWPKQSFFPDIRATRQLNTLPYWTTTDDIVFLNIWHWYSNDSPAQPMNHAKWKKYLRDHRDKQRAQLMNGARHSPQLVISHVLMPDRDVNSIV